MNLLLCEKFMQILSAKDSQMLHEVPITEGQLREIHTSIHKNHKFRYYFEVNSSVQSPWISYSSAKKLASFIGAYSYINDGGYIRDRVLIGRFCSIGRRVTIAAGTHSMAGLSTSAHIKGNIRREYTRDEQQFVISERVNKGFTIIESDVWIGDGAVIMPGITVGTGAVVGANSVVTKNLEPYGVYAGAPAKLIKKRFPEDIIARLLKSTWWEYNLSEINKYTTNNIYDFIEQFELDKDSKLSVFDYKTYTSFN